MWDSMLAVLLTFRLILFSLFSLSEPLLPYLLNEGPIPTTSRMDERLIDGGIYVRNMHSA